MWDYLSVAVFRQVFPVRTITIFNNQYRELIQKNIFLKLKALPLFEIVFPKC